MYQGLEYQSTKLIASRSSAQSRPYSKQSRYTYTVHQVNSLRNQDGRCTYLPCRPCVRAFVSIVSQPSRSVAVVRPSPPGLPPNQLVFALSRSQRPSLTPTAQRNTHECCKSQNTTTRGVYSATLRTHTSVLNAPISTEDHEHIPWLHPIRKVLLVHR